MSDVFTPTVEVKRFPPHHLINRSSATSVYEVDPINDQRWTALLAQHPNSSVFHTSKWARALKNTYGYQPFALTTSPPAASLKNGLIFCRIDSWLTGRRLVSMPFSDHCEPLLCSTESVEILADLYGRMSEENQKYFEIRPVSGELERLGCLFRGSQYVLHRLDLRQPSHELFRKFHKDCVQRKIRRAERENLRYEEGKSEKLLQSFYRLLVKTRRRQKLPPQPLGWFRELVSNFGDELKIRVAFKGETAISSILTIEHKTVMTYKYGCSDAAFNSMGGTALLFWNTIRDAKERGFEELDFGRTDVDNQGLIRFKENWGATRSELTYLSYPLEPAGLPSAWQAQLALRLISKMPSVALEIIGWLGYGHIG